MDKVKGILAILFGVVVFYILVGLTTDWAFALGAIGVIGGCCLVTVLVMYGFYKLSE